MSVILLRLTMYTNFIYNISNSVNIVKLVGVVSGEGVL